MMLLSRFWYAILAVFVGAAVYAVMVAVGQYNRASIKGTNEALAGDSNVVRWAIQIDSRRRIDALMWLTLDKAIQDSVVAANDKDKIPAKSRDDARKALTTLQEKIPAQYRPDATFVVDHDGRVIAELGYPAADKFDDFELGGYSAVNDALHGWLRDDTWVWSGQLYRVAARPLETDVAQPPVGAVIGIRALDRKYAQELVNTTQTNIVFYALGQRVAGAGVQGFDESLFDQIVPELAKLDTDPTYTTKGHSEIRDLSPTLGAVFAKLDGDAFELGGGFAVVRPRVTIQSGSAFLSSADETDRKNVSWPMLIGIVVAGLAFGLMLTFLEHDRPLRAFRDQASKLKQGAIDLLQLPQLGGPLRDIGADINAGIERVAEKGGGAPRKAADLEAIVGHAEPGMSAFAFPMAEPVSAVRSASAVSAPPASGPKPLPPNGPGLGIASIPTSPQPLVAKPVVPPAIASKPQVALPPLQQPETNPTAVMPMRQPDGPLANNRPAPAPAPVATPVQTPMAQRHDEEEQTMVASVPQEVLARASGEVQNADEVEWPSVYEDFVKTKKQCGEPTEGLTFDKFRQTLRKNRDALVQRHNCKRVKFTVYVKDGRASLKATPIKD